MAPNTIPVELFYEILDYLSLTDVLKFTAFPISSIYKKQRLVREMNKRIGLLKKPSTAHRSNNLVTTLEIPTNSTQCIVIEFNHTRRFWIIKQSEVVFPNTMFEAQWFILNLTNNNYIFHPVIGRYLNR